ncbi:hypothetical protein BDM02DRAFT_2493453 [Thelephora ganbajun]|uniref:Uncharacterized protein n=1 Tax=Thelephora ganbajun TaxID=370292 RepID=A0ACB6ZEV1_THEGA|nr:hypothetical protein BDM02DRAFT_2493453 [Thelephora ganbajun]
MATRVFKLDELATRIATHLLAISSKSTVALALTCRDLEVPALRTLWETQFCSLESLIKRVLSTDVWGFVFPDEDADLCLFALQRPLTTRELNRLKRYASWVRRLNMREWGLSREITRLVVSTSPRTAPALRFHLRELNWWLNESNLTFLPKFLSPHLTKIVITTVTFLRPGESVEPWGEELPREVVSTMRSAIKTFPSSLQFLHIQLGVGPETRLSEEISTFVLGYGESLQKFSTNLVLSTQAIAHLMKLPNLRVWATEQGPPQVTNLIHHGFPSGATSFFPSLKAIDLRSEAALEWLSLFEAAKKRTPPWIVICPLDGPGRRLLWYGMPYAALRITIHGPRRGKFGNRFAEAGSPHVGRAAVQ